MLFFPEGSSLSTVMPRKERLKRVVTEKLAKEASECMELSAMFR